MELGQAEDAFVDVVRRQQGRVFGFVLRRVSSREVAEELTNDVFRVAWSKGVAASEMSLAWLLAIARNVVGNEYRSAGRREALMDRVRSAWVVDSRVDSADVRAGVAEVLGALREGEREVLLLAYWEDLSVSEIAEVLGVKVGAAKVRLHRARQAFARLAPDGVLGGGVLGE
ncbi:RNA polymerase sigma factor [Haematomicrobium sanguinis]|uniref:RNA polymerase sigma factor n=1 Tax=Haematomicrobium sanguinis TaxID=479106 RepID=UPI00047C66FC|nr:sigma-70 family RNA polymerase sigma factor [Haematomicrobium sanguinis]